MTEWDKLYQELKGLCEGLNLTLTDCAGYTEEDLKYYINQLKGYVL